MRSSFLQYPEIHLQYQGDKNNNEPDPLQQKKKCPVCKREVGIFEIDQHVEDHILAGGEMQWETSDPDKQLPNTSIKTTTT